MSVNLKDLLAQDKVRYLVSGGTSAALEYASFFVLTYAHLALAASNVLSFMIGLVVSFLLHRTWSFKGGYKHSQSKQFLAYGVLALVNTVASTLLIQFLVQHVGTHALVAKVVCMVSIVVWNYIILNKFIFRHFNATL